MITVVWGSNKQHFTCMDELKDKYSTLNNQPAHIMPKPPKGYKSLKLNSPIQYTELPESRIIHYAKDSSDVWINTKKDL